ncbi:Nnf1-domain-containing protein [Tuber borchii]|uniref:Nnf1-domain-containing protein n=1 Tax=Tuber borchii TaxID=42251 RepID=A0A2T6ZN10_TUBBO|nr:Nnf1-domain-containing protein [Tuber borchii]
MSDPNLPDLVKGEEDKQQPEELVEGIRATALRNIFTAALDRSIKTCSYENFAACFPTPARRAPEVLRNAWEQMCGFWESSAKREYETILKERNVVSGLNALDELTKEAEERRAKAVPGEVAVSPSTLPPATILTAQLTPLLLAAQKEVAGKIEVVQGSNTELMGKIEAQRREIEELVKLLEGRLGMLDGAVEVVVAGRKEVVGEEIMGD